MHLAGESIILKVFFSAATYEEYVEIQMSPILVWSSSISRAMQVHLGATGNPCGCTYPALCTGPSMSMFEVLDGTGPPKKWGSQIAVKFLCVQFSSEKKVGMRLVIYFHQLRIWGNTLVCPPMHRPQRPGLSPCLHEVCSSLNSAIWSPCHNCLGSNLLISNCFKWLSEKLGM